MKKLKIIVSDQKEVIFWETNTFCERRYQAKKILKKNCNFKKIPSYYCSIISRKRPSKILACIAVFKKNSTREKLPLEDKHTIICSSPSLELGRFSFKSNLFLNSTKSERERTKIKLQNLLLIGISRTIAEAMESQSLLNGTKVFADTSYEIINFFKKSHLLRGEIFQEIPTEIKWDKIPEAEKAFFEKKQLPKVYEINLFAFKKPWRKIFAKQEEKKENSLIFSN